MESLQTFEYRPLSTDEIRLVYLLPPRSPSEQILDSQQLRCSIKTVSLEKNPEYVALSYCWGKIQSRTSLLMVSEHINDPGSNDETALYTTDSVKVALLNLRHSTSTTVFWIDQLSINQKDIKEKSSQVPLMKAIYERAEEVIVWLGSAADESDHLIEILDKVGSEACKAGILHPDIPISERKNLFQVANSELTKATSLGPEFRIPTESLRSFVNREWWSRVWVVQELSLARCVTFACGDRRISYEHLRNALYFYAFHAQQNFNGFRDQYSTTRIFLDPMKRQQFFALARAPVNSAADKMLMLRHRFRKQIENSGGYALYRILQMCHVLSYSETRLNATNAHDKIYGLLGLAGDVEELVIRPDYEKPLNEVYTEVAGALIAHGYVDLLWFSQFPKLTKGLPTWAPDWMADLKSPYGDRFSEGSRPFAASGNATVSINHASRTQGCNLQITLHGAFVDKVAEIGSEWTKPLKLDFDTAAAYRFVQDINRLCDEASVNGRRQDSKILDETRWRTPIGDKEWNDAGTAQRATELSYKVYEEVLRRIEIRSTLDTPPQQWSKRLLHKVNTPLILSKSGFPLETRAEISYMNFIKEMYNRRPFRTENGYVGLGPIGMLSKDVVCIVLGAQVPYVLRPCDVAYEEGLYQLIGESYIHGIMNGEFMEKKPPIKEFTLC